MKRLLPLLASLALAAPAAAQTDPFPNEIGVYFDPAGMATCSTATAYAILDMYLLATRITDVSGISGWEAHVYFVPTPAAGVTYALQGTGAVNTLAAPDFRVGIGSGVLPHSPAILLMTMSTFYLGGQLLIGVGEIITAATSFPETHTPGYASGADPSVLTALTPSSNVAWPGAGDYKAFIVANVNGAAYCVDVDESSWGSVKTLYQ